MKESLETMFVKLYGQVHSRYGTNIKVTCPECGHKALACEIVKGLRCCFHCGYGKGMKPIDGIPSMQPQPEVNKEIQMKVLEKIIELTTLSDSHKEYLMKRGVYNPELYKLRSVPAQGELLPSQLKKIFTEEELISSGFFSSTTEKPCQMSVVLAPRRIIIPHWQGDSYISCKSRIRPYVDPDDVKEMRYASPRGSGVGTNIWYKRRDSQTTDLIITEGELCAMVCNQSGITTIGIPGLKGATNQKVIKQIKEVIAETKPRRIFIVFDTDPEIRTDKDKINCSVTLRKELGEQSCIVYLPQDKPTESMDLDLYLSRYEIDDLYNLLEDAWPKKDLIYKSLVNIVRKLSDRRNQKAS